MKARVLVVDDEENNRIFIRESLEDLELEIIEAVDGDQGWEIIQERYKEIDLILLDKMMPGVDGLELLKMIREKPEYSRIPVIMQTAAGISKDVNEGFRLGVFHYLIKPYDDDVLASLVAAALRDGEEDAALLERLDQYEHMLNKIDDCNLSFKSLDDAEKMSAFLATFYPDPKEIVIGIRELLINAVEHGNLGITFDEKTALLENNSWKDEVLKRLEMVEYSSRKVKVKFVKTDSRITLRVIDEGEGFDWKSKLDLSDDILMQSHGRGIPMCKHMYFTSLIYNEKGNEVTAEIEL